MFDALKAAQDDFFNALVGEEWLELSVLLPSERILILGIDASVLDYGCIGFMYLRTCFIRVCIVLIY